MAMYRRAKLVRALDVHGGHARVVARARAWLAREVAAAMRGDPVEGWPNDFAMVAGTLALAAMAGVDVGRNLAAVARADALRASAWHAAQVVAVLGTRAPEALWQRASTISRSILGHRGRRSPPKPATTRARARARGRARTSRARFAYAHHTPAARR
jgi:hypothetical protein